MSANEWLADSAKDDSGRRLDYWAEEWQGHQRLAESAKETLRNEVALAHTSGLSEVELSRRAGVSRMTIRKWLGKGPHGEGS